MKRPKHVTMIGISHAELVSILKGDQDKMPIGECILCHAKPVPVYRLRNCNDETDTKDICLDCFTGKGASITDVSADN